MHVLFATSECAPLFKKGGLGDVSSALPKALARDGVTVTIVMPYYGAVSLFSVESLGRMSIDYAGKRHTVFVFSTTLPKSTVRVLLLRHQLFDEYQTDNMVETFAFFSRVVAHLHIHAKDIVGSVFDIIHCHDWHTALIPLFIGENNKVLEQSETNVSKAAKTVLTIHNLLYQGVAPAKLVEKTGKPLALFHRSVTAKGTSINFMREGIEYADMVTTVSPTYAKEIMTPEHGEGLYLDLLRRRDRVRGILNGIDTGVWNPETDTRIARQYNERTVVEAKKANTASLRLAAGLLPVSDLPVISFIGRLEGHQKGIDLVRSIIRETPPGTMQFVILGTGDMGQVALLNELSSSRRDIAFINRFDEDLAHKIYAGSDLVLIPSKFEPCGLIQMIAMRYGTVPVVRQTGGLADSVRDGETGFVFREYEKEGLKKKLLEAVSLKQKSPARWEAMVRRIMAVDFSWEKSAKEYKRMYEEMVGGS
jgi:starch synthase